MMDKSIQEQVSMYVKVIYEVGTDVKFWETFGNEWIENFLKSRGENSNPLVQALFSTFDYNIMKNEGFLKTFQESRSISLQISKKTGQ